jgi:hypothetical protein
MFMAFGVTFEIPIAVIILVRSGVVSVEKLTHARPYVIVGAFVVAAVVTPPDVLSQFMLGAADVPALRGRPFRIPLRGGAGQGRRRAEPGPVHDPLGRVESRPLLTDPTGKHP